MKKFLLAFLFLALLIPTAYSKNLYKGFEKGEFSLGIEERCDFESETCFSFGYALSNRYEFVLGYMAGRDYHNSKVINMDINFHFFPKRRFDLYFGIGPSYCTESYTPWIYSIDDTLLLNPIKLKTREAKYLGGMATLGTNFYPFKNVSLDFDIKTRWLAGIDEYGYDAIGRGGAYLGIKYIF